MGTEIIKIDDDTFKKVTTTEQTFVVSDLRDEVANHRRELRRLYEIRDRILAQIELKEADLSTSLASVREVVQLGVKGADNIDINPRGAGVVVDPVTP